MNIKEITCFRNSKPVLHVRCIINDETFKLMIKNKIIFYLTEDLEHTEFIMLDHFERVTIDGDLYSIKNHELKEE